MLKSPWTSCFFLENRWIIIASVLISVLSARSFCGSEWKNYCFVASFGQYYFWGLWIRMTINIYIYFWWGGFLISVPQNMPVLCLQIQHSGVWIQVTLPENSEGEASWTLHEVKLPGSDGRDIGCNSINATIVLRVRQNAVVAPMMKDLTVTICQRKFQTTYIYHIPVAASY